MIKLIERIIDNIRALIIGWKVINELEDEPVEMRRCKL